MSLTLLYYRGAVLGQWLEHCWPTGECSVGAMVRAVLGQWWELCWPTGESSVGAVVRAVLAHWWEQCWGSGENVCLPPMGQVWIWPWRYMWVDFVGSRLCSQRFLPGCSGFAFKCYPCSAAPVQTLKDVMGPQCFALVVNLLTLTYWHLIYLLLTFDLLIPDIWFWSHLDVHLISYTILDLYRIVWLLHFQTTET